MTDQASSLRGVRLAGSSLGRAGNASGSLGYCAERLGSRSDDLVNPPSRYYRQKSKIISEH